LKQKELRSVLKIFYKSGRLILKLILHQCSINLTYSVVEGINSSRQIIVFAIIAGGGTGFAVPWFNTGSALIVPPLLFATLLVRSFTQQVLNYRDYVKFKDRIKKILEDDELKQTLRAFFVEVKDDAEFDKSQVNFSNLEKNSTVKRACESLGICKNGSSGKLTLNNPESLKTLGDIINIDRSSKSFKKTIKEKLKQDFGLIKNSTDAQLTDFINAKIKRKRSEKTTYFSEFIKNMSDSDSDIIKKFIKIKND